jgi:Cys-rich protein (TIGR01571 family)
MRQQQQSAMQGFSQRTNPGSQQSMHYTVEPPYQQLTETPRMRREINAQAYLQYRPPQIIIEAQPKVDIDWNIPILAKDLIIDAEAYDSPKKQLRIRESKNKKPVSPKKKPTSPSSITSDPTAVVSNVKRHPKGSSESDESREMDIAPRERREQDAIDIATESIRMDPLTSTAHVFTPDPTIVKPIDGNYKLDIARNKSALVFNEAQTQQKNSVMRKSLMDEVDRIHQRLSIASGKDEKDAYISYLGELQVELEKWNRLTHFGTDKQSTSPKISTIEHNREMYKMPASVEEIEDGQSFGTDKFTIDTLDQTYFDKHEDQMDDLHESGKTKQSKREKGRKAKQDGYQGDSKKHWRVANVVAPETLPEGFKFEARNGDEVFIATVPRGGVRKGEIFSTGMGDIYGDDDEAPERTRIFKDMDAPPSRWRDELFDCFRHGLDHPFLCNTIFCPLIALHQVLTRIQMDGTGDRLMTIKSRTRVCFVVWLAFLFILVHALYFAYFMVANPQDEDIFLIVTMPLLGMDVILLVYVLYIVTITRRQVRREYNIPELRCKGFEDCCMSVFCTCCIIGQMGRHTADYETYRAYCCSDTGLANHIEVKLPVETLHMDHGDDHKQGAQLA